MSRASYLKNGSEPFWPFLERRKFPTTYIKIGSIEPFLRILQRFRAISWLQNLSDSNGLKNVERNLSMSMWGWFKWRIPNMLGISHDSHDNSLEISRNIRNQYISYETLNSKLFQSFLNTTDHISNLFKIQIFVC